ncbi:MAG: MotA/TolQ/ExbB proton channel family protein [Verrucomicrobia bacterium]|nr:MotA/TolQ/ExbB proton channel family protein [Verrucomicrobiota bacterium]
MKESFRRWIGWMSVAGLVAPACAMAQAAAGDAAAPAAAAQMMTVQEIFKAGGILMYPIAALSIAALAFIIYLFVALRLDAVAPADLLHDLREMLGSGRREEARLACRRSRSALAAVGETGLTWLQRNERGETSLLKEVMEGEGSRQAAQLQNQTQYLLDIAVIAPMVGLLGTVVGMLQSFNAIALDLARARPMTLAAGVAMALITTIGGLVVGIPAMAFYAFFRGRVAKLTAQLETAAADLLGLLLGSRNAR